LLRRPLLTQGCSAKRKERKWNKNDILKYIHIIFIVAPCIFEINIVHSPTNALFVNLVKSFKFTLKYTIISHLYVSLFSDHHL